MSEINELNEIVAVALTMLTGGALVAFGVVLGDLCTRYERNKDKIKFKKKG